MPADRKFRHARPCAGHSRLYSPCITMPNRETRSDMPGHDGGRRHHGTRTFRRPDRRRRAVRHRRGLSSAGEMLRARATRSSRGATASAAPGTCSAIPASAPTSDMFTLGYSFKPWTEPKAIADGPHILNYVRETAAENGIDKQDPLQSSRQARVVVVAGHALDGGGRAHGRARARARPCASPAISCSCARAITNTRKATRRNLQGPRISPAASCIRRNGPTISTMRESAWW